MKRMMHFHCFIFELKENLKEIQEDINFIETTYADELKKENVELLKSNRQERIELSIIENL